MINKERVKRFQEGVFLILRMLVVAAMAQNQNFRRILLRTFWAFQFLSGFNIDLDPIITCSEQTLLLHQD